MERTILEALGYYLIRLVMFGATAAALCRDAFHFHATATPFKNALCVNRRWTAMGRRSRCGGALPTLGKLTSFRH